MRSWIEPLELAFQDGRVRRVWGRGSGRILAPQQALDEAGRFGEPAGPGQAGDLAHAGRKAGLA
ncbi:hypothetical protein QO018_005029 [Azospirillum picis]|uniref:Uncharacterized protein n=1 Tax=Azospirillum picis TaxID=488438 RepID=A0ABU0MRM6_9PROT|nr:hypothetical protein [Azospirillum picis]